jgi:UDP-N-acetylmuramoyl-L-alanyl-D-glutamate--2,6-diaminopimelate ligase
MRSGDRVLASTLTTPEAADLQALLAAMAEDGVDALAMEASSHALAQHRVDPIVFDVAGFTNLTRDHLDFHNTMDEYFDAKALLFTPDHSRRAVITVDDEFGRQMAERASVPVATLWTGTGPEQTIRPSAEVDEDARRNPQRPKADWVVRDIAHAGTGSAFTLAHRDGRELRTMTSLPGGFNVANAALALTMVIESGADFGEVVRALADNNGLSATVPGRMEVISAGEHECLAPPGECKHPGQPRVLVDFAHNTEALEMALSALRPSTHGNLILVFGATGDRDKGKRPDMAKVAVDGADIVVVTDDDPHGEDPAIIRAAVLAGAVDAVAAAAATGGRAVEVIEVPDRRDAIWQAIKSANANDTILIAGRGHETIQEVAGVDLTLDDRVEARSALAERMVEPVTVPSASPAEIASLGTRLFETRAGDPQ